MQGTIGASCQFYGLEPYLAPLRPLRGRERTTALAIRRWLEAPGPELVLGRARPPRARPHLYIDIRRLEEVAHHLALWDEHRPSMTANELAGIARFMLGNLAAGRAATDYADPFFDMIQGEAGPSGKTRNRWQASAKAHRRRAARMMETAASDLDLERWRRETFVTGGQLWIRDRLQYWLDLSALWRGGRNPAAARQWLRDNPGKHAHDAPPPRRRRAA